MPILNKSCVTWSPSGFIIAQPQYKLFVEVLSDEVIRVRSCPSDFLSENLTFQSSFEILSQPSDIQCWENNQVLGVTSGSLTVQFDGDKLEFFKNGKVVLTEYARLQSSVRRTKGIDDTLPIVKQRSNSAQISPHHFRKTSDDTYQSFVRFESDQTEIIYGLGGYQEKYHNKNGGYYQLQQRNSQTSLPTYISNKGYGFMWNHAGIGEVHFARNQYCWSSYHTNYVEYIVFGAETLKEGVGRYTGLVGRAPIMPEQYLGLWQSKLRYQTLDELKEIYQGYRQRNINLSVLVIDYFHWPSEGSFEFDNRYWQGIDEFAIECRHSNTELMVSVWPTVTQDCPLFEEYQEKDMLMKESSGSVLPLFNGAYILDFTDESVQEFVRKQLIDNYWNRGIRLFWADQAEPELSDYQHQQYQISKGNLALYSSQFSCGYLSAIPNHINRYIRPTLIRTVWFGGQSEGALAWSGDIESSFESLEIQIQIGLSMGLCGQAWWTSDIGGFHAYTSDTTYQKELMRRWFQFATFSPILRMHGDRQPHTLPIGKDGGGIRTSGAANEIWSFGSDIESCLMKHIKLREWLKPYLCILYEECHLYGWPLMRPLSFEFPNDHKCWKENKQYMFGSELLVAPVVQYLQEEMLVYLPIGCDWINLFTKEVYEGGKHYRIKLNSDYIPVFAKVGSFLSDSLDCVSEIWRM
ncbi:TIM-barrel domain-containing protein [Streptococcus marmotae]|uniref:TIM-barrel domain-containing protein n=1 Tax=Streptococcus marmotae TaxID=1825069 RepID=UPI0008372C89|nr:TIM-barrel domain-containing protein [Streptococcus marmotae]